MLLRTVSLLCRIPNLCQVSIRALSRIDSMAEPPYKRKGGKYGKIEGKYNSTEKRKFFELFI